MNFKIMHNCFEIFIFKKIFFSLPLHFSVMDISSVWIYFPVAQWLVHGASNGMGSIPGDSTYSDVYKCIV